MSKPNSAAFYRSALRVAAALLCAVAANASQAVETEQDIVLQPVSYSLVAASHVKTGLMWLRDVTTGAWTVTEKTIRVVEPYALQATRNEFAVDRSLFRPLNYQPRRDALKRLLKRQVRLEMDNGMQLQCEVKRYRTVEDGSEVGLKLGLQFKFR